MLKMLVMPVILAVVLLRALLQGDLVLPEWVAALALVAGSVIPMLATKVPFLAAMGKRNITAAIALPVALLVAVPMLLGGFPAMPTGPFDMLNWLNYGSDLVTKLSAGWFLAFKYFQLTYDTFHGQIALPDTHIERATERGMEKVSRGSRPI